MHPGAVLVREPRGDGGEQPLEVFTRAEDRPVAGRGARRALRAVDQRALEHVAGRVEQQRLGKGLAGQDRERRAARDVQHPHRRGTDRLEHVLRRRIGTGWISGHQSATPAAKNEPCSSRWTKAFSAAAS